MKSKEFKEHMQDFFDICKILDAIEAVCLVQSPFESVCDKQEELENEDRG